MFASKVLAQYCSNLVFADVLSAQMHFIYSAFDSLTVGFTGASYTTMNVINKKLESRR